MDWAAHETKKLERVNRQKAACLAKSASESETPKKGEVGKNVNIEGAGLLIKMGLPQLRGLLPLLLAQGFSI